MKTIINIIKYLFYPNWKIIHTSKSIYETWNTFQNIRIGETIERIAICKLEYSKTRNKYRIIFEGYISNEKFESKAYLECLQKQLDYEKKVMQ